MQTNHHGYKHTFSLTSLQKWLNVNLSFVYAQEVKKPGYIIIPAKSRKYLVCLKRKFSEIYDPQINVTVEWQKFNTRFQNQVRLWNLNWVTYKLKLKAANSVFYKKDLFKIDLCVASTIMVSEKILLHDPKLTLAKAIAKFQFYEMKEQHTIILALLYQHSSNDDSVHQTSVQKHTEI